MKESDYNKHYQAVQRVAKRIVKQNPKITYSEARQTAQKSEQRTQSKPQQSTKIIKNSKNSTSISTHISPYGPKPGRVLGHKNLRSN